jgi:hypothetical protein
MTRESSSLDPTCCYPEERIREIRRSVKLKARSSFADLRGPALGLM